jgi:hypothetical protein
MTSHRQVLRVARGPKALRYLEEGHAQGKVLITV